MKEELVKKIRACPTLPSLPAIAVQVLELAQKDHVDIAEIARVISKDPALSSKILRTVNSSFYGRANTISTISHALVLLGLQSVKTLVLGFSLVGNLSKTKTKGFKHVTYWRRSVYAATAARLLAGKLHIVQQEECFLGALLMDIGMLVLDQVLGEEYGNAHDGAANHQQLTEIERKTFGLSHAEASGVLAEQWKLPPVLAMPMAYHDHPKDVPDPALKKLADVVSLSGRCADVFVDEQPADAIAFVRKAFAESFQINEADCDALMNEISTRTREVASLFELNISDGSNFESILKRANETLVDLTLRSQQQAEKLTKQNIKLKEQAATDGLTGLGNRASFDQFLAKEFAAALETGSAISLLMIDVDHFKKVNDQFGHPIGDQVLKVLGQVLRSVARPTDIAARYGGEELALVLPNTPKTIAAGVAEKIRRAVCAKPMIFGSVSVPVSVSIGVAAIEHRLPFKEVAHFVKAADLAVYAAKHLGRNCVKIFSAPKPDLNAA
ncbi:MAG TPA: GGDEF domain-containing protein [Tepidisphaeraceae bacterium]|nr:GGDEF domain-containing protein [Tepidisphaeraceae bacterium]